jgi:hypothetical protein
MQSAHQQGAFKTIVTRSDQAIADGTSPGTLAIADDVALPGISASLQMARRLSPSASRSQIDMATLAL